MTRDLSPTLRALSRVALRVRRRTGPIVRDALLCIWKLLVELVLAAQLAWRRWQARRKPDTSLAFETWRASTRERRAARWAFCRTQPLTKRLEVGIATGVILLVGFVVARAWWRGPHVSSPIAPATASVETPDAPPPAANSVPARRSATAAADAAAALAAAREAATRFSEDRKRIAPGQWAILREPPIFERGELGTWSDYDVGAPVVIKEDGGPAASKNGARYRMWYRGCRLALREHACGVGHATSADGIVWARAPAPVFAPADPLLRDNLDEIAVAKVGGRYFLWYSALADPFKGRPRATVHLATSPDGLAWTDEGKVMDGATEDTFFIWHSVFHDGQQFHLWYATRIPDDRVSAVLQHFSSPDGKAWTAQGGTRTHDLESQPTVAMGRLLIVAVSGGQFLALFTHDALDQGRKILGSLTSPDGTTWTATGIDADPLMHFSKQFMAAASLSGVLDRDGLWLWMTIRSKQGGAARVGVAFRKGDGS